MASEPDSSRPSSLYMDLKELRNRFDEVDTEKNGYIDYKGLQDMISNMDGFDSFAVLELMKMLDRDGDGKVTFEDFQVVFTLERDAVKAEQRQHNDSRSAYVTTLHSPTSPANSCFFSPERPPAPHSGYRTGHRTRKTPTSLTQVPYSPDLSMHVRSLQRTTSSDHSDYSQRLSMGSEHGDQVLEDIGTVGATLPSPGISPAHNTFMGLELIDKELHSICKNDTVERKDMIQLCNRLGVDGQDEQEFLGLWDELRAISSDTISVDVMYQSIKQRETIAMVTSTPANQQNSLRQAWQKKRSLHIIMQSFETHSQDESQSQNDSILEDEEEESSDEDKGEWVDGGNFPFHEIPRHSSGVVRPSSAREGSRLSRGQSESSLRQTATMQRFYSDHRLLSENLEQVVQERDMLKVHLARVENEKKQLIQEGEESVLNLQRQKETTIRKLETEFFSKQRSLETSLSIDHRTQQESLEIEIIKLKGKYHTLKSEDEALKEDLKYYQTDNAKLIESIDQLHNELAQKDEKISLLQDKLGLPSESLSESDLELHTSRIQELENNIQVYIDHNEDLRRQNTELQDKVDELMVECEKIKQKYVEEKRKRQRKGSDVTQPQTTKHSHHHRSRHSKSSRTGRQSSHGLPIPNRSHGGLIEEQEMTDGQTNQQTTEILMISDEESTKDTSIDEDQVTDDIAAQSSTSLLEEIKAMSSGIETDEMQQLAEEVSILKMQAHKNEVAIEKGNKEIKKQQEYITEQRLQLQDLQDSNGKLQEIIEQQSSHIAAIANDRIALENQLKYWQTKSESQERDLKRTRNESRLAIHDLTKKEEECSTQQEKVMKLENELLRLHGTNNQQMSHLVQLESYLSEKESEMRILIDANNEMEDKLNTALEALRFGNSVRKTSEEDDEAIISFALTSPRVFSPDLSYSSSVGQTDILYQMKNQLHQLQTVLIDKSGEEGSEIELSFVQELLQMNTSLEDNLIHQHQAYDLLVLRKDEEIEKLKSLLASDETVNSGLRQEIALMQDSINELKTKEERRREVYSNLEDELMKEKKNGEFQKGIIDRQIEEIKKLNHYLGKARSKQVQLDTEKEKMDMQIQQQEKELMNQSLYIQELQGAKNTSQSVPEDSNGVNQAELLTMNESLLTAEQLISSMREQVLTLYQHVIKPSDSRASDLLEFSELIAHLKETFDTINDELISERETQESLHGEYDALYSERDEEVRAIEQQRDNLLQQMSQMEQQFEQTVTGQINAFDLKQAKLKEQTDALKTAIDKVTNEKDSLESVLGKTKNERDSLEAALEQANDTIDDLNNCKAILIKLIHNISLQTLSSVTIV